MTFYLASFFSRPIKLETNADDKLGTYATGYYTSSLEEGAARGQLVFI